MVDVRRGRRRDRRLVRGHEPAAGRSQGGVQPRAVGPRGPHPDGASRAWPVVHTIQVDGVCDEVIAPAQDIPAEVAAAAEEAALRIARRTRRHRSHGRRALRNPGTGAGFLINELAMRPHNTGHWTQDGSVTSQFEQHLRAVLNLPLGATDVLGHGRGDEELPGRRQPGPVLRLSGGPGGGTGRQGPLLRQVRAAGTEDRSRQPGGHGRVRTSDPLRATGTARGQPSSATAGCRPKRPARTEENE